MTRPAPSAKPLAQKLGVKPGMSLLVLNAPEAAVDLLAELPDGASRVSEAAGEADCVLAFVANTGELGKLAPSALKASGNGQQLLWFAYPKITAKVETDLTRDRGWDVLQEAGLRGIAMVAVDATWSALRFRPAK